MTSSLKKESEVRDLKVLIIDDASESRNMLKSMLTEIGITQVFEAGDGREGLKFIDTAFDYIDIVLCDWNMPNMNGMSLLKQLRSVDNKFPFMMITGRGDIDSVSEAKGAGVSGYMLKPFSIVQLETKLRIITTKTSRE